MIQFILGLSGRYHTKSNFKNTKQQKKYKTNGTSNFKTFKECQSVSIDNIGVFGEGICNERTNEKVQKHVQKHAGKKKKNNTDHAWIARNEKTELSDGRIYLWVGVLLNVEMSQENP